MVKHYGKLMVILIMETGFPGTNDSVEETIRILSKSIPIVVGFLLPPGKWFSVEPKTERAVQISC